MAENRGRSLCSKSYKHRLQKYRLWVRFVHLGTRGTGWGPPSPRPSKSGMSLTHSQATQGEASFCIPPRNSFIHSLVQSLTHPLYSPFIHLFTLQLILCGHSFVQSTRLFAESLRCSRQEEALKQNDGQ